MGYCRPVALDIIELGLFARGGGMEGGALVATSFLQLDLFLCVYAPQQLFVANNRTLSPSQIPLTLYYSYCKNAQRPIT